MVDTTIGELRRALSEMNEGVRALLGPEPHVPELVGELLDERRPRRLRARARAGRRFARRHLELVK